MICSMLKIGRASAFFSARATSHDADPLCLGRSACAEVSFRAENAAEPLAEFFERQRRGALQAEELSLPRKKRSQSPQTESGAEM